MMTILSDVFDLPESTSELVHWLEEQLCGEYFAEIVEALSAVQDQTKMAPSDLSIKQERLELVLENGLSSLDRTELNQLLESPRSLYQLQEAIFVRGGDYWLQKFDHSNSQDSDLLNRIIEPLAVERPEHTNVVFRQGDTTGTVSNYRIRSLFSVVGALAASVLIFLGGTWFGRQQAESEVAITRNESGSAAVQHTPHTERGAWGWNREDALEVKLDRTNKLNHIANLLSEWNSTKCNDSVELLVKAQELRQSCDVLLAAKLSDLPEDDVRWLREKCRTWSAKIDEHIVELFDSKNFEAVNTGLNRLVHKSIFLIRARANKA